MARDLLWKRLLDADLNYRYFTSLTQHHLKRDRAAKVFLALTSSAAVSGWALWSSPGFDWIWKALSAMAAVVAVALPVLDPATSLKSSGELATAWFSILGDYEVLWARVDTLEAAAALEQCETIQREEKRWVGVEATLAKHSRLARQCELDVRVARGLPQSKGELS